MEENGLATQPKEVRSPNAEGPPEFDVFPSPSFEMQRKLPGPSSSVKWGHLGHFDIEPNKQNFPTNLMGSSGTL